jgi:hypothetical protein
MKILKLPNGELDWVAMYEKSKFRTMQADIEIEPLERFVIDAQSPGFFAYEEPSPGGETVTTDEEAATHAAELIILVMGAIKKGEKMDSILKGYLGVRKERSNLFYPDKTTSTDVAWQIAKDRMLGKPTWDETIARWEAEVCYGSERAIRGWVAKIEPRIKESFTPEEIQTYINAKK